MEPWNPQKPHLGGREGICFLDTNWELVAQERGYWLWAGGVSWVMAAIVHVGKCRNKQACSMRAKCSAAMIWNYELFKVKKSEAFFYLKKKSLLSLQIHDGTWWDLTKVLVFDFGISHCLLLVLRVEWRYDEKRESLTTMWCRHMI